MSTASKPNVPFCGGEQRRFVCSLCGRPPGERCAKTPAAQPIEPRQCPACEGAGTWPKESDKPCPVCEGGGTWKESGA